jgi:glyoxylase I family protein
VSHISFSVSDAEATTAWWQDVFGLGDPFMRIEEESWKAVLMWLYDDVAIEFQQHTANAGETFDPARTGFDHMGIDVATRAELDDWQAHFERLGVEHTPVVDRDYGGVQMAVLTFKDPDRIQYEMFWAAAPPA